jgi:TonB family protein
MRGPLSLPLAVVMLAIGCGHVQQPVVQGHESERVSRFVEYWMLFKSRLRLDMQVPGELSARPPAHDLVTVLRIRIDSEGRLVSCEITEPSGDNRWDSAAELAVQGAQLPAPPIDLLDKDNTLTCQFGFMFLAKPGPTGQPASR